MKQVSQIFKWSWIVTLPIAVAYLYWGTNTLDRFYTFGVRYNTNPIPYHLHETGEEEFFHIIRKLKLAASNSWKQPFRTAEDLKLVNLYVSEANLAQLNSNLPHSGYNYVEGRILNRGEIKKMKLKYRGDFVYHWGSRKKSLRVKTSKKALFNGVRRFNLIGTKQLETHFGLVLAKELGLIAPRSELVEVMLNGELIGTHVYVEQLEELTIRYNDRMPGDLYAGELMAKDSYKGIELKLFNYPQLWEKAAINNHYDEASRKPLEKLLALAENPDSESTHKELIKLLDVEAWGRMAAFETLTQSYHYDNAHNWRLYYDPMKNRFYPIIWDPLAWPTFWVPKSEKQAQLDIMPSALHQLLFKNAEILKARAKTIEEFFKFERDSDFLLKVEQMLPGLKRAVLRDPLITLPPDDLIDEIHFFNNSIKKVFADVRQGYLHQNPSLEYAFESNNSISVELSLSVFGRMPMTRLQLSFAKSIDGPIKNHLTYVVNGDTIEKDISGATSVSGTTLEIASELSSRHRQITVGSNPLTKTKLQIDPAYYKLTLAGILPTNQLLKVTAYFGDKLVLAESIGGVEKSSFTDFFSVVRNQPMVTPLVWKDTVDINKVTEIHRELVIEPGTVVRMAPGASLILTNNLLAKGSPEKPILFVPMSQEQEPWGSVALVGNQANGSKLRNIEFSGGSGLKGDLYEYTAMLSIHDVKNVLIENGKFQDSKLTDDMVHIVYSEVRLVNCIFQRSLMDALDIDISDVVIEANHFIDSGNDAIDLMTSHAIVLDTMVENSKDKAISVGEGSQLLAINNVFKQNEIAVQAKDGSIATLYNVDIDGNNKSLDAYKKNWRYNDGGKIFVYKSRIVNSRADKFLSADKKSSIWIHDSYIDKELTGGKRRIHLDNLVDRQNEKKARKPSHWRHPKDIENMQAMEGPHWDLIQPSVRGASL